MHLIFVSIETPKEVVYNQLLPSSPMNSGRVLPAQRTENPFGYSLLSATYQRDYWLGNTKSPRETLEKITELAQKALSMDDSLARPHNQLCWSYLFKREYDKAIAEAERAVALDPSGTNILDTCANCLRYVGRPKEAIPIFQKAIRLNPLGPSWIYTDFGHALRETGRYEEAISAYKKAIQLSADNFFPHLGLAITYSMIGREKEAHAEATEVLRINPKFSLDYYAKTLPLKDQSKIEIVVDSLRKAGLK